MQNNDKNDGNRTENIENLNDDKNVINISITFSIILKRFEFIWKNGNIYWHHQSDSVLMHSSWVFLEKIEVNYEVRLMLNYDLLKY